MPSRKILLSALTAARSRNGKPYCATATAEAGIRLVPGPFLSQTPDTKPEIKGFLEECFGRMMTSPSASYVVSIFQDLGETEDDRKPYRELWEEAIDGILAIPDAPTKSKAIMSLISLKEKKPEVPKAAKEPTFVGYISQAARCHAPLQQFFLEQAEEVVIGGKPELFPLLRQALLFDAMDATSEAELVAYATHNFFGPHANKAWELLDLVFRSKPILLRSDEVQTTLALKLFSLADLSHDNNGSREASLRKMVDALSTGSDGETRRQDAIVRAINYGLESQTALR